MKLFTRVRAFALVFTLCSLFALDARAQTYTSGEFVASAPLAWQTQHDPAGRLTIGNDDGNALAASHATAWASTIRYGGAQGLSGLLYDMTIDPLGPPAAFGLARRGCVVSDATTLANCVRARWEPRRFLDSLMMVAVVTFPDGTTIGLAPQTNVQPGEAFSIERFGNTTINFYRSTGTAGERRRVATTDFPFTDDGFDATTPIEARAVFAPDSTSRKLSQGQELYFCCP